MSEAFVLDCSVTMAWCFEDEADSYDDKTLRMLETGHAFVPGIWVLEVANVLLVAERHKRLSKADTARFVELLQSLPIRVEPIHTSGEMDRLLALARGTGLSSYDACYLDLAMRRGLALATLDKPLRRAAKRHHVALV